MIWYQIILFSLTLKCSNKIMR